MTIFDRTLTTVAFCWRIERRDGVALGFTTHERDIVIGGLVYRASPGMLPSSITMSDGFDAEALDVEGALTSDAIRPRDLEAGRWDGASVRIFMVDWEQPEGEQFYVTHGELGEVSMSGDGFEAELRGRVALLERPVVEQTSPTCRAELGDKRCRVDMADRTILTRVIAVDGNNIEVAEAAPQSAYAYGRLRWIGGRNSGLDSDIAASDGALLTLRARPHFDAEPGDLVEMRQGCDKSFATCTARFANAANFRGEPHLPGMDLLTRYPGA